MKRFGVDPAMIDYIFLSHLHGDHFGGIPFLIRETQIVSQRKNSLTIAGPQGLEKRIREAMETFFPGSASTTPEFPLQFVELSDRNKNRLGPAAVSYYGAVHTHGTAAHSLRIEFDGKVISYSGDTEWNDNLVRVAEGADIFICESFFYEKRIKNHLSYLELKEHLNQLTCGRVIITHMSDDMLGHLGTIDVEAAADGKTVSF
jgi:ribonuclease BN (tRNA processing enzyme)